MFEPSLNQTEVPGSDAETHGKPDGERPDSERAASRDSVRALTERLRRLAAAAAPESSDESDASADTAIRLRRMRMLHEPLGPRLAKLWSGLLRAAVDVRLAAVERDSVGGYLLTHDRATCCMTLQTAGLDCGLILEIELTILYPLITRLLGGGLDGQSPPQRPLTMLEQRLAERIAEPLLVELQRVWASLPLGGFSVARVANQASIPAGLTTSSEVCIIRFEIALGPTRGDAVLVLPGELLARLEEAVDGRQVPGGADRDTGGGGSLDLAVLLTQIDVLADELRDLQVGDVILTDRTVDDLAEVTVNGIAAFRGKLGAIDGHKAIRLE